MDRPLSELFVAFADYCMRRGIGGEGIHEIDGPDGLKVTMNSTREPHGALPAFHAAIMARGWPIAVINPYGGDLLCLTEWDEAKLIDAFKGDGPTPGVDLKAVQSEHGTRTGEK